VARVDGYLPIEDYAAIGDGRTLALVGRDGAIDWMCLPELEAPSMFAALLDPAEGGQFTIAPAVPFTATRRYLEGTNVLETTFHTEQGSVQVLDALTFTATQASWRELVRRVSATAGRVPMRWRFRPRFGFGARAASLEHHGPALIARDGQLQVGLRPWGCGEVEIEHGACGGSFELGAGEVALLAMFAVDGRPLPLPERSAVERRLQETISVWRSWVSHHHYDGPWRQAVERSLLAIRLLADGRSGAITAAGTSSLPETLDGKRNYDYRFCWIRDLCFTLDALLAIGMEELVQASVAWLLEATIHTHPRIDPVYTLGGEVVRSQDELGLSGYRHTPPVHVGNDAGSQLQLGGFGDFIETLAVYVDHGHVLDVATGQRLADIGDLLAHLWRNEDSGLWELSESAHYGSSKLGCWTAFDRLLGLVERGQVPARNARRWQQEREAVEGFIERRLYSERKRSYLFKAGGEQLDCTMLLAGRRGFGTAERRLGTIDSIRRELHAEGPLFYRYSGMQDEENAFLACSFWMIEALAIEGRADEAAAMMDTAVGLANDVGLCSEELEPRSRAMRGNFPQALTHLALISAADAISRHGTQTVRRPARSAPVQVAGSAA